jgi:hypothetical protein
MLYRIYRNILQTARFEFIQKVLPLLDKRQVTVIDDII